VKSLPLAPLVVIPLLVLLGFAVFPGHTWLQSDTQIYAPILEHLRDPSVLAKDIIALQPHVSYTIYDETALALSRLTGFGFAEVLAVLQILTRLLGLLGVYLMARAISLGVPAALVVAGCFGLGATINGPAVLTLEYEPVPRGFAVLLVIAALGFAAGSRWLIAGILGALAFLVQPPTAAPFWACAIVYWIAAPAKREKLALPLSLAAAAALLALFAWMQGGEREKQLLVGRIDPALEQLQRFRGAYNWLSLWPLDWLWQYPLLFCVSVGAWFRLRRDMTAPLRFFSLAMPVYGLLMMPFSYLALDVGKWILMPQFQPARAVLFITVFAVILCAAAGWRAASHRRFLESCCWFFVVFAVPANGLVLQLLTGAFQQQLAGRRFAVVLLLALLASLAAWLFESGKHAPAAVAIALVLFAPPFLIPTLGQVRNYPALHTPQLQQLCAWARSATQPGDVFLFADVQHGLQPGIFRECALRNIYVDWKGGGQANLLKGLGAEWWWRWQAVGQAQPPLLAPERYRELGIDYLVVRPENRPAGAAPVFSNSDWEVISLKP
jgi:hypothetical protein